MAVGTDHRAQTAGVGGDLAPTPVVPTLRPQLEARRLCAVPRQRIRHVLALRKARAVRLRVAPITVKAARRAVAHWHRHLPRVVGGLFATSVIDEAEAVRGVAIVSLPVARLDMDGWTCEVVRVATDGAPNACSLLYSTCRRTAQLLGYRRCLTKTLPEEGGHSLLALGLKPIGLTRGGEWSRPSRARPKAARPEPKVQWDLLQYEAPR